MSAKNWCRVWLIGLLAGGLASQVAWSAKDSETGTSTVATNAADNPTDATATDETAAPDDALPPPVAANAADNPAAYLPVQLIPPEIDDPAFDRYVDLTLLARAWEQRNASLMADVAIQLSEGERVLQRPHRTLSSAKLLEVATQIAIDSHDKALLERLGHIADQPGQGAWKAQVSSALKLAGEARAVEPGATVSVEEMSPSAYAAFHGFKTQIEAARIAENTEALDRLQHSLTGSKQLPEKQRKYLEKLLAESRTAMPQHVQRPGSLVAMDKLVAAGEGGVRSADSAEDLLVEDSEIPGNLADPAFDRYVDLHLLGQAWDSGDAVLMTDVALQILEGQRILLRPHRAIAPQKLLEIAARLAIDKRDQTTLQRLAKIADQQGQGAWKVQVASALKLGGEARAVNPALMVSVDDMSPDAYAAFHDLLEQIQFARAARDAKALDSLKQSLAEFSDIPAKQRNYLEQQIGEGLASLKGVTDPQQDALADAMNKLADSSRAGRPPSNSMRSNPVHNNPVHNNPVHNNPIHNNPIHNNPIHNNPIHNNPIHNNPIHNNPIHNNPIHNNPIHNNPIHNHPIHDHPIHDHPIHDHPIHDHPIHDHSIHDHDHHIHDHSRGPDVIIDFRHRHHHWHWFHPEDGVATWVEDDGPVDVDEPDPDVYAAIAYSPSSGNLGVSSDQGSVDDAQAAALADCNTDDAQIVVWCKNNFCAFATADDGTYGAAWADSQDDAESQALANCTPDQNPQLAVSMAASDPPAE